jgi:hypothetical protein
MGSMLAGELDPVTVATLRSNTAAVIEILRTIGS